MRRQRHERQQQQARQQPRQSLFHRSAPDFSALEFKVLQVTALVIERSLRLVPQRIEMPKDGASGMQKTHTNTTCPIFPGLLLSVAAPDQQSAIRFLISPADRLPHILWLLQLMQVMMIDPKASTRSLMVITNGTNRRRDDWTKTGILHVFSSDFRIYSTFCPARGRYKAGFFIPQCCCDPASGSGMPATTACAALSGSASEVVITRIPRDAILRLKPFPHPAVISTSAWSTGCSSPRNSCIDISLGRSRRSHSPTAPDSSTQNIKNLRAFPAWPVMVLKF
jgi:hypothetical protein